MAPVPFEWQSLPYFYFDACSQALVAQFERPFGHMIEAQASSSICSTGGLSSARVDNYRFHEFISFSAGHTLVSANYDDEHETNDTLAMATVEGLNILDVLTADRIVARTYSKHLEGPAKNSLEGRVTMHGCKFENLRIYGKPVTMELNSALFDTIQTFEEAQAAYLKKGEFWQIARDPFQTGNDLPAQKDTGAFLCSLVTGKIHVDYPGVQTAGHSIFVPGFGIVHLAEMVISHGQRTFSMIRFDLDATVSGYGSGVSAYGSVCCGTTNGKQYPPGQ
jgi:hypothetical protein